MLYRTVLETAPLCEYKLNAPWSIQWDSTGLFPFTVPFIFMSQETNWLTPDFFVHGQPDNKNRSITDTLGGKKNREKKYTCDIV